MLPNCDNSAAYPAAKTCRPQRRFTMLTASRARPARIVLYLPRLTPAPVDLNVEVADLLAQGVAVEAEQVGGADLVATGRGQRRGQERHLDLLEDAVIEPRRRHAVRETGEV